METFNPAKITPNASLNRVVITHIPWLSDDLWGKDGYQLLGRPVLLQRVLETFPSLQATPDPILPFEELCRQGNPDALTLATDYGHRLASLIATLHEASDLSRQARPDWDESYWVYWKQVDRFILGGGLMSGHLGRHVFKIAGQLLGDRVQLSLAENPKYLSLIGCAVERMSNDKTRVLIDCGSTSIKSGLASYETDT